MYRDIIWIMKNKERITADYFVAKCNNDEEIISRNNRARGFYSTLQSITSTILYFRWNINEYIGAEITENSRKQRLNPLASEDVLPVHNLNPAIQPAFSISFFLSTVMISKLNVRLETSIMWNTFTYIWCILFYFFIICQ